MKPRSLVLVAIFAAWSATAVSAAEPYLEMVQALRNRAYFDYAILYLDELAERPNVPADVKAVLDYQRYLVYRDEARLARIADDKDAALEKALAALDRFATAQADHPLAADANSERASLYLDKAKALIWSSRLEDDVRKKTKQQEDAREWIAKARPVYQTALTQYEKAMDQWKGQFVSEKDNPAEFEARRQAEQKFIQAGLNLAMCTYEEARTYDVDSDKLKELMKQAAEAFEAIHNKNRSQGGGLYARLYQGKSFEEQGEYVRAMGIYNELLEHPGESEFVKNLQAQTFYFKLIVLNTARKEFRLVMSESTKWIDENPQLKDTTAGLGIQMERARAYELLSEADDEEVPFEDDRAEYRQFAYNGAEHVSLYAGEFQAAAFLMMERLEPLINSDGGDPKTFKQAFAKAKNKVGRHKEMRQTLDAAKGKPNEAELRANFEQHLTESERLVRLALSLADETSPPADVAVMRFCLAYTLMQAGQPLDAAVVADFVARTSTPEDDQQGQDSAFLALAALSNLYFSQPEADRDEEREMMTRAAELLAERWPNGEHTDGAFMTMGDIYRTSLEPEQSAAYYDRVPETSDSYPDARIKAGQQYWVMNRKALADTVAEPPPKEDLDRWTATAIERIRQGLALTEKNLSAESTSPPDIYIAGKVTLAEILISQGQEAESLKILTGDPHSVMKAIKVEDETQRPRFGPQSRPFAIEAYAALLRSYMGTQQIDQAIQSMGELEAIAGKDNPDNLTAIYVQLGLKLREEIDSLKAEGNSERMASLLKSFDAFLTEIYKRKNSLDKNILLWIAESYSSLGEGVGDDPSAAENYFGKAADAYQFVLEKAAGNPEFLEARFIPGVRVRIAVLKRRQGQYDEALAILKEVLTADAKMLEAQFEASDVMKSQAEAGGDNSLYMDAIVGNKGTRLKGTPFYGLTQTANLIRRVMSSQPDASPTFEKMLFRAMYEIADCQMKFAAAQPDQDDREKNLKGALATIKSFALYSGGNVERDTWNKFDDLYQVVKRDLGEPPGPLERPRQETINIAAPTKPADVAPTDADPTTPGTPGTADKTAGDGPNYLVVGLVLLLIVGATAGIVVMGMKKPKRRRPSFADRDPAPILAAGSPAATSKAPAKPPAKPAAAKSAPSSAAKPPAAPAKAPAGDDAAKAVRTKPTNPNPPQPS